MIKFLKAASAAQKYDEYLYCNTVRIASIGELPALKHQFGAFARDGLSPVGRKTFLAAKRSAWCALAGAEDLYHERQRLVYALCRPPGHHAGRSHFGGFCYFNNAALAAKRLVQKGPVAILDIDYHHGNGTQEIFYTSTRVLFLSLHYHPGEAYPFFNGYAGERGAGRAKGFNENKPLPSTTTEKTYRRTLEQLVQRITKYCCRYLIVSLGFDGHCSEPLDVKLPLRTRTFTRIGKILRGLQLPTLLVQEGGYNPRYLSRCLHAFLSGMTK